MTRHIADHGHPTGAGRVRHYLRQDRESGIHPAILRLSSRARRTGDGDPGARRLAEYARIERGRLT